MSDEDWRLLMAALGSALQTADEMLSELDDENPNPRWIGLADGIVTAAGMVCRALAAGHAPRGHAEGPPGRFRGAEDAPDPHGPHAPFLRPHDDG